jgi:GH25 family lysozyme M1 (1,4-beta-N-acetylmuramidase)
VVVASLLALVALSASPARGQDVEGVDVSEFQGAINWPQAHGAGIAFGIARVSDGVQHLDPTFHANWNGMKAAGVIRGTYQFFRASEDPIAQANLLVAQMGALEPGDLPPTADVEVFDGQSAATLVARLQAWVNQVRARTGVNPIIYTAPGFWDQFRATIPGTDLWVADWFVRAPVNPVGWSSHRFWQYVDNGHVPGIPAVVDRDRWNGSLADLVAYAHGAAPGSRVPPHAFVGIAMTPDGGGYWICKADGSVFSYGNARFHGAATNYGLAAPIVGIAATPDGGGYWLVAADGGVFGFGNARFFGSMGGVHLDAPVVGMAVAPNGDGYWLVAADGGVFTFGGAFYLGGLAGVPLNEPVVGMAATADGRGYWLFAADGGVFAFGDAHFLGSLGGKHLNAPIVGGAATPSGKGLYLVAADGGVFGFGDAVFAGSAGSIHLNAPVAAIGVSKTRRGYTLVAWDGGIFTFGGAGFFGSAA